MTRSGDSEKIPPQHCPHCGYELLAASSISGAKKPTPGAITVCIGCAGLLCFNDAMKLVTISAEEAFDVLTAEARERLEVVQLGIRAHRGGASLKPGRYKS
jgi:hypothetical protein